MPSVNGLMHKNKPQKSRTHHHKQRVETQNLEDEKYEIPSPDPKATLDERLEYQIKSDLVRIVLMEKFSQNEFNSFRHAFVVAPVPLSKKLEYLNEVIDKRKKNPNHLIISSILCVLPQACENYADFCRLHPMLNAYHIDAYRAEELGKSIALNLLRKLKRHELFELLMLKIEGKELYKFFNDVFEKAPKALFQAIKSVSSKCTESQIQTALVMIRYFNKANLLGRAYEEVLPAMITMLHKAEDPSDVFGTFQQFPMAKKRTNVFYSIQLCFNASIVEIPKDQIQTKLFELLQKNPTTKSILFDSLTKVNKGYLLYYLIKYELLPPKFSKSKELKECVFDYIQRREDLKDRQEILLSIKNHQDTPLNRYLWPEPKHCLFFSSKLELPVEWINKIDLLTEEISSENNRV